MSESDREKWNRRYRDGAYSKRLHPSVILQDWLEQVPPGRALDVACGAGRNSLFLAEQGFAVDAVDISADALNRASDSGRSDGLEVNWLERDLDAELVLEGSYQLILVVRYVNLALLRQLVDKLAPGGFLICEQHLVTDAEVVGPTNSAYRVQSGELAAATNTLRIHQLYEGLVKEPDGQTAALAQLVAEKGN